MSALQKKAVVGLVLAIAVTAAAFIPETAPYVQPIVDLLSSIPGF